MLVRLAVALLLLLTPAAAIAQQPDGPVPLFPGAAVPSIAPEPLPPIEPAPTSPPAPGPDAATLTPPPAAAPEPAGARIFCHQAVTPRLVEAASAPEQDRRFVGIWSDASWTPQLCAALIVEAVAPDGKARIVYVFGPMTANPNGSGGVLHGTGIVHGGELRFQNSDGSQFGFRPLYGDLAGRLTTPQGQTYDAIFKKTP